jgi:opacity protein-like surface antigen
MKRTTILAAVIAAAAAVVAAPALAAQQDFHWSGKVAAGAAIEIKGVNGGIDATGAPGGDVEVTATKKARKSDPAGVKIEVVEHAGGVTICAVYPSNGTPNECQPGPGGRMKVHDNDVNVEFRVKVPAGVRFVGRTVNGGIQASGIAADAEAHTVNGGVHVDAAGTARAETVNGGITAHLGRADWTGTLKLKTVNGGIDVAMPDGLNADVKASTVNGDIETDFPLTVKGRISRRKIEGTIGSGGRLLEVETVNGGIELRKAKATK